MVRPGQSEEFRVVPPAPPAKEFRALHTEAVSLAVLALLGALFLVGGSPADASKPSPPVPAGTQMNVTPISSTPPTGAVLIGVAANAKRLVDKSPPGTAFVISAGTHSLFSVIPQPGDRFFAQAGAVLDGAHTAITAFKPPHGGTADNVEVIGASRADPLVIENYGRSQHSQTGAIQTFSQSPAPGVYSTGWWVQWVEVTGSSSRGMSVSNHMVVLQCRIVDNDRLGIGGGGNGITIDDTVVSDNGIDVTRKGWEAGGIKTVADNVLIENDEIDGNGAPGIWTDSGATNVVAVGNHLSGNTYGVRVEISNQVRLAQNTIVKTAQQSILVIASQNVTVTANTIEDNFGGIIVGGVGRYNKTGIHLNRVFVNHNHIADSGATGLHQVPPAGTVIRFDYDDYVGGHLQWFGHRVTLSQLQALGQERHGTWTR
jgi:parallel beta-helix repeat protein